jgi:predicted nucleic acid-binding protein
LTPLAAITANPRQSKNERKLMNSYLDTSVISALFDERTPERQNLTKAAWDILDNYDVYISELVLDELSAAPPRRVEEFQRIIVGFSVLKVFVAR